jgi:uncharacterized protein YjiS (DUF1127 family)
MRSIIPTVNRTPAPAPRLPFFALVVALFHLLSTWCDRARERRHLLQLGDEMLKDIGVSRVDVEREYSKPFWLP